MFLKTIIFISTYSALFYILSILKIFSNNFNLFLLILSLTIFQIILIFVFISDIFSSNFFLSKQGSKLNNLKNNIYKGD